MAARLSISAVLLLLLACSFVLAQEPAPTDEAGAPEYEMTTFQLVFLRQGFLEEPIPERRIPRMKNAHEFYLEQLFKDDAAVIAGPIVDDEELRHVAVLDVGSTSLAEDVFLRSPVVEVGQLEVEAFTWWAAKDLLLKPKNPRAREDSYLGLLMRPDRPKHYPKDELEEIQKGHLAHIRKMADAGDLVIAGPIEEDGQLRGILIFRTTDVRRIQQLVSEDPAVQKGRLELKLYRWQVPIGTLPTPMPG